MPWRRVSVAATALVSLRYSLGHCLFDLAVDWAWFSALGYLDIFWTVFSTWASLFLTVFAATAFLIWLNGWLASRLRSKGPGGPLNLREAPCTAMAGCSGLHAPATPSPGFGCGFIFAGLLAAGEVTNWDVLLRFVYQVPYGQRDPVFDNDIGFYLFSLPAFSLSRIGAVDARLSVLRAGTVYWLRGHIELEGQRRTMSPTAIGHGSALLGVFFAVKAWSYGLDRYLLLYGDNGVVVGASYTDMHVELPVLWVLIGLALFASLRRGPICRPALSGFRLRRRAGLRERPCACRGVSRPFERLFVRPNELELEKPYIQRNITLTRQAYNLHQMAARPSLSTRTSHRRAGGQPSDDRQYSFLG